VSLIVAGVGIYGVLAYSVSNRTNEIGLRMVLGADRRQVMRLVVGEGMVVGLAGTSIGLVAAAALIRVLASLLFGVEPHDPLTFGGAAVSLVLVALAACAAPAWRASRVDPIVALRQDWPRRRHYALALTRQLTHNGRRRCFMGDRGKKDKDKGQKQHAAKDKQEEKQKLDKQPKRNP
jgi:predicted lysophospholipase L1 biosynthesis ABC-type transport system permease subunit